jgi:hypothetical protein
LESKGTATINEYANLYHQLDVRKIGTVGIKWHLIHFVEKSTTKYPFFSLKNAVK